MFVRLLLVAVVLVAFSAPASAFYCPNTGKAITAALGNAKLSAADKAKVEELRDQGMAQHKAGDHKAAVSSLAESARIILNAIGM